MIRVLYFAWLRERIGVPMEDVATSAVLVSDLIAELRLREPRYELAFSDMKSIRVAVDQVMSSLDAPLSGVKEVAFFPPMTGG